MRLLPVASDEEISPDYSSPETLLAVLHPSDGAGESAFMELGFDFVTDSGLACIPQNAVVLGFGNGVTPGQGGQWAHGIQTVRQGFHD